MLGRKIRHAIRHRRLISDFDRAMRHASPAMQQELMAAAARQEYPR